MIEILPIRLLTPEDARIFGSLNVALAKLSRFGLAVGNGIVITPPQFKLRVVLEHFDFGTKEVFEQTLTLVKKEINSIPLPEVLIKETGKQQQFLLNGERIKSVKGLWLVLLHVWFEQIKGRLWDSGFYQSITEDLDPQAVIFVKKLESLGFAHFDPLQDDVEISVNHGKLHPNDQKKIFDMVQLANKKLFIPHRYEWILDGGVKLVGVKPYAFPAIIPDSFSVIARSGATKQSSTEREDCHAIARDDKKISAVKVFFELSKGFAAQENIDGIYLDSGKIFDLNKPRESFEELVLKLVGSANDFPGSPILFKLADKSEGMGKVRGTLRLLHQSSLFEPLTEALDFVRHKKGFTNIHIVIPFVRGVNELLQIKRELAVKKLARKNSLGLWMEVSTPENIVNLEDYLLAGIDGVVLNLDELISYLNGFNSAEGELAFYKQEVEGLLKFLEDGIRLLHKSKIPFIAYGSLALYPKVLEFLVEKGVWGIVVERYDAHSAKDLLNQTERRIVLRKTE
ncbi:MAG: hypothetical protein M1142_03550 [Patescibacteria group bacterium]|nr:hypothetical protein [Patescibacteria group bacterium]